jgi:CII-binding regulator of phage lambda lysogenization HflD
VLWRQMGGSQWGLFVYRRRYCEASRRLLASM